MDCYICYEKETKSNNFCSHSPCNCKGTNKIHIKCLEELKQKCGDICSICKSKFKIPSKNDIVPITKNIHIIEPELVITRSNNIENIRSNRIIRELCNGDDELYNYILQVSALESYSNNERNKVSKNCCSII